MSDLPAATRRALDQIVNGPGRVPTTAHPDCTCVDERGVVSATLRSSCPQHGCPQPPEPSDDTVIVDEVMW